MFDQRQSEADPDARTEARRLRRDNGMSLPAIAARLGRSRSTVYYWIRDIELTPEQRDAIRHSDAVRRAQEAGRNGMRARAREKRLVAQQHGRHLARAMDPLHAAGCMLYWAEGSKRRNVLQFTNSDPDLMRTFLEFLRRSYGVRPGDVRLALNVHLNNGLSLCEIETWWLTRLELSPGSLCTHTVDTYSRSSSRTRRTLPYGTARITVHSTFIVQSIYGAIQEYARIERAEWLDR